MASESLRRWMQQNRQNVFSNGRGATILINVPSSYETELFDDLRAGNLLDSDVMDNGAVVDSALLPIRFHKNVKLLEHDKAAIRKAYEHDGESVNALADIYNVHRATISRIINGHTK